MTLLDELKDFNIITSSGQINKQSARILSNHQSLQQRVLEHTSFLPNETSMRVRIKCIMDNITSIPRCKVCDEPVTFNNAKGRFNLYCANTKGKSCSSKDARLQAQIKDTLFTKYGVDNAFKSPEIRERIKQTNIERYGGVAPIHDEEIKNKIKESCIKRYGTINVQQNENVRNKRSKTNIEKYGMTSYAASLKDDITCEKIKELSYNKEWLTEQHHTNKRSLTDISEQLGISLSVVSKRFKQLQIPVYAYSQTNSISADEEDFRTFISQWIPVGTEISFNDKNAISPYELDVYIPRYNLAFEYNGIFWHSELNGRTRMYHSNKTKMCDIKGIRLVQVWSSEWQQKQQLVKNRIKHILRHSKVLYGRNCTVESINFSTADALLKHCHIQGGCSSSIQLGLFFDGVLFGVMTFGKPRFNKQVDYELLRFAVLPGYRIVGGASKLLSYFKKQYEPNSIITYSDRRWNKGDLYTSIGFKYSHTTTPNYFYFNRNSNTDVLYSRNKFQKHKLSETLELFDPNLTEWENMQLNGYDRIWDCGNDVFVWNKE